jgi:hypothetical protein
MLDEGGGEGVDDLDELGAGERGFIAAAAEGLEVTVVFLDAGFEDICCWLVGCYGVGMRVERKGGGYGVAGHWHP